MTKLSPDILPKLVSVYAHTGRISAVARALGINRMTVARWLEAATEDEEAGDENSKWFVTIDGHSDFLTAHLRLARKVVLEEIEENLIEHTRLGRKVAVYQDGERCFEKDERYIGVDDETMKLLGLDPVFHRYKRDAEGRAIPAYKTVHVSTPDAIMVLSAHDDKWAKKSNVNVKQDIAVSGGVWVAAAVAGKKPAEQIAKPVAQIELVPDELSNIIDAEAVEIAEPEPAEIAEAEPAEVEQPKPMAPQLTAEQRRATNPGAASLLAMMNMPKEERIKLAQRTVSNQGAWLSSGNGAGDD